MFLIYLYYYNIRTYRRVFEASVDAFPKEAIIECVGCGPNIREEGIV